MTTAPPAAAERTVTVRLFGPQARLAGADRVDVPLPQHATADDLLTRLQTVCPPLGPSLAASRIAVDHAYAAAGDPVPDGAEVALIGLVSGG